MHVIAAKAVALEALQPDYKVYIQQVVQNAKALADTLLGHGFDIVSGGTDNHLVLVDLRPKGLTGDVAEAAMERAFITCNKNGVPFDPAPPMVTSGVRLGTPAGTTRGFGVAEFQKVGDFIARVLDAVAANNGEAVPEEEAAVRAKLKRCARVSRFIRGFCALPYCMNADTQVKDSRPTEENTVIRRRRVCADCGVGLRHLSVFSCAS